MDGQTNAALVAESQPITPTPESPPMGYDPIAQMKALVDKARADNRHTGAASSGNHVEKPFSTEGHQWHYLTGDYWGVFRRCKECRKLEFYLACYTSYKWADNAQIVMDSMKKCHRDGVHESLVFERDFPWMWDLIKDRKKGAPWCKKHPDFYEKTAQWREDKAKRILAKKEARDGKA
jgi:hypothetical protein